jgi:hypothetical protein
MSAAALTAARSQPTVLWIWDCKRLALASLVLQTTAIR